VMEGESATLPDLEYKTDEWIGAGMSAPVEIRDHLEKLTCEWSYKGFLDSPFADFGEENLGGLGLVFIGAYESPEDGRVYNVTTSLRGNHKKIQPGELKRGEQGSGKVMSTLTTYQLLKDNEEKVFIDVINGIERYNGKDIRSNIRQALGI
jgi:uncharacterized protein